jgi:uncharacterized protein YjbJ (UPF0337 family)
MNTDKVEGEFDQVAGKVKQGVGETVGNQRLANAGVADQIKGAAKETWGNAKDTAGVVHEDNKAKAHAEGDNLRDRVANSTQNAKNSMNEKLDDIKREHRG